MEQILKHLQDPSWWFTVVFVALVVSVAANYLRDWLSSVAARYSVRVRRRRHKRLVALAKDVRILKSNFQLLVSEGIELTILLIILSFMFLSTLMLRILQFVEPFKADPIPLNLLFLFPTFITAFLGF